MTDFAEKITVKSVMISLLWS